MGHIQPAKWGPLCPRYHLTTTHSTHRAISRTLGAPRSVYLGCRTSSTSAFSPRTCVPRTIISSFTKQAEESSSGLGWWEARTGASSTEHLCVMHGLDLIGTRPPSNLPRISSIQWQNLFPIPDQPSPAHHAPPSLLSAPRTNCWNFNFILE